MIRSRLLLAVLAVLSIFVLAVSGLWGWLGSDGGRRWLADTIASQSDGRVVIRALSGHPLTQISAGSLLLKGNGVEMTARRVTLAWSPWRLLSGELSISMLKADRIDLRSTASAATGPQAAVAVPLYSARLDALDIGELNVEQGDGTSTRISAIRIDGFQLGKTVAGHLQAELADGNVTVQLAGQLANWRADGKLASKVRGEAAFSLAGHYLHDGEAKLELVSGAGGAQMQALWQQQKGALTANGKLKLHADRGAISGAWKLHAPLDFSRADISMHAVASSGALLARTMPLEISAIWKKENFSAVIKEQEHGLKLALGYSDALLQGDLTLIGWDSPLKNAAGRLSGSMHGSWQSESGQWRLQGDIDKGELAGLIAGIHIDGEGDAGSWQIRRADIHALGLKLDLAGQGDSQRFKLTGSLAGTDIAPALQFVGIDQAAGNLQADIALAGSYAAPHADITAKLRGVKLASVAIDRVSLSGTYAASAGACHLVAGNVSIDGRREMEKLDITGRLKAERLSLKFSSQGRLKSSAGVAVGIADPTHTTIVVTAARVSYAKSEWLAADRLALDIDGSHFHLPESDIRLLGSTGTVAFDLLPERISGKLALAAFNISGNEPWLAGVPYHLATHVAVKVSLAGSPQAPTLVVELTSPALRVTHPMFATEAGRSLLLSDVRLKLDYGRQELAWQLQAKAPAGGSLASSGQMAMTFVVQPWQLAFPNKQQGSGAVSVKFSRLSDLQALLPRIDPLKGSSNMNLSWSMPMTLHSAKGSGVITLDAIGIPEFGLEMKGGLTAALADGKPSVDLHLHSGDGELVISGPLDIDRRTVPDLKFKRFALMNLPDQQLVVSGTISASEQKKVSIIKGALEVVKLRLEIPDPVAGPTTDLQWKSDSVASAGNKRMPLSKVDVDLLLSGDAEIYGRGMSMKPTGKLHLGGSVTQPKLTGVLDLASGKIEFRSVKLDIQPGSRVVFSGDPKRPSIYVKAARKIGDITAGVIVEGPVDQLTTQLYSQPAMSNAEIFSYIATGRPLASLGKDGVSDMMTAAEFLLGPGTMMQEVQGKVEQVTGLDVFEVGGDASGGKIRAGRKLSDKVTLTVDQTVSRDASTALTLQYMLTKSLSLFGRQTVNMAPMVGLRYSKEWFGPAKAKQEPKHDK
ncbi:translocation/assembly module TamB domain-containing protein [Mariprofundus ferrooxydans]|uniref:translocation/assembly module TamB domain-containing protein n=1 Tax=Mariprofundus ferrooxydans TaxID=314344 RepID=UPI000379CB74|nr:translocation/assembly module TamB domain-containing protein [Mariprofundus ferrooxydans]